MQSTSGAGERSPVPLTTPHHMKQTITIEPDGSLRGLQTKKGKGVDLKQFGKARIRRATIIRFSEKHQQWYVVFLDGSGAARGILNTKVWCAAHAGEVGKGLWLEGFDSYPNGDPTGSSSYREYVPVKPPVYTSRPDNVLHFEDYDDAVAAEVAVINAARVSGYAIYGQAY